MRILNWMQKKLNGSKKTTVGSNCHPKQEACKEEFSDWPNGLLAIGTFGNHQQEKSENSHSSSEQLPDFVEEEVGKFQKELRRLLSLKPITNASESRGEDSNHPLNKFLNCPSSLVVDQMNCEKPCDDLDDDEDGEFAGNISVILNKAKEICMDKNSGISQRSISFLLKKMFICHSGFAPAPSLRDRIPESKVEKLLRAILQKKIFPQKSASSSPRKYLVNKCTSKTVAKDQEQEKKDQEQEKANNGSKWVKTDSNFIVLEM